MNEEELTRRLSNAADIAPPASSPFDMTMSASHHGRLRPPLVVPAVAGLLIVGGLGFVAGRHTSGSNTTSTAAPAATPTADHPRTSGPEGTDAPIPTQTSDPASEPTLARPDDEFTIEVVSPEGGPPGFGGDFVPVIERTVGDVRVRISETPPIDINDQEPLVEFEITETSGPDGVHFDPEPPDSAPECEITIGTLISLDGRTIRDALAYPRYTDLFDEPTYAAYAMATMYQSPVVVVDVVAPGAVSVSATALDPVGQSTDASELSDGRAVLVLSAEPGVLNDQSDPADFIEVTATMADGSTVAVSDAFSLAHQSCGPSPLPAAGEQPSDPHATFAEVEASLQRLVDPDVPRDEKDALLDDWTGVGENVDSSEVVIEDHVFTSPTEVWFRYIVRTSDRDRSDLYGVANRVDGAWQFRRQMMCERLTVAGGACTPAAGPIGPNDATHTIFYED